MSVFLAILCINVWFLTKKLCFDVDAMLVVNGMLFWSSVKGFSKADFVFITVEDRVVELHEIITTDEEVIETSLSYIESTDGVLTCIRWIIRACTSFHPVMRGDRIFFTIDDICQIAIPMLQAIFFAVSINPFWLVSLEFVSSPWRESDEWSTCIRGK